MAPTTVARETSADSPAKNTRSNKEAAAKVSAAIRKSKDADSDEESSDDEEAKDNGQSHRHRVLARMAQLQSEEDEEDDDGNRLEKPKPITKKAAAKKPQKANAKKSKGQTEEQKKKLLNAIQKYTIDHIELTEDGKDVASVGGIDWSKVPATARYLFCKSNKIAIPHSQRRADLVAGIIINHMNGATYKDEMKKTSTKKAKHLKPNFVKKDGTFWKFVNVITSEVGKVHFIKTVAGWDKDDVDRVIPHLSDWDALLKLYLLEDEYVEINHYDSLLGFNVPEDIIHDNFDVLDIQQFRDVAKYVISQYKHARNKKNSSGNHGSLATHLTAKQGHLMYLQEQLDVIQCQSLTQACFPELKDHIKRTPTNNLPLSRSKGRSRSTSPVPGSGKKGTKKEEQAAIIAAASQSIQTAREASTRMMKMDNLRKCRNAMFQEQNRMDKYHKYKSLPRNDKRTAMKKKYQHCKKMYKIYEKEYEQLKEDLEYESDGDSTDSSHDDVDKTAGVVENDTATDGSGKKREWRDGPGEEC